METIAAAEIRALGEVERVGHREVWFTCPTEAAALGLRCVDDVFRVVATVDGVGRARADLRLLAKAAAAVDPPLADGASTMDVSASFLGRRNYNRYDLEDAVGEPLAAVTGLRYHSRRGGVAPPPGGLSWRLTVTGDRALLALRLADRPLHRRAYRTVTRPGSLHPPLAAAMLRLAGPLTGRRLLDPCCGAGTIPLEASTMDTVDTVDTGVIVAVDHDPVAVAAAVANGLTGSVVADAGRLPLGDGSVDVVVSNPPWDRQVPPTGMLVHRPDRFWRELRRVLRPGGRAVLLLPAGAPTGLPVVSRHPVSLFGSRPEMVVMGLSTPVDNPGDNSNACA